MTTTRIPWLQSDDLVCYCLCLQTQRPLYWRHARLSGCVQGAQSSRYPARQVATRFQLVGHDLGDREFCNRVQQSLLQAFGRWDLGRCYRKTKLRPCHQGTFQAHDGTRIGTQGLQFSATPAWHCRRHRGHRYRHQLLRHGFVCGLLRHGTYVHRQTAG